jgi:16S rRNA (adenine1518-N6/adenine1519-N6)-dimethyltransferase
MVTTLRKILESKGIRPLKHFGQSFLEDQNIIRKISSLLDVNSDDTVVEIGAGLGVMTEEIAKKANRVIALEIDRRLIEILQERLTGYRNVEVVCADVMDYDFSKVEPDKKIKVIGNIPYNISSQILMRLIGYRDYISHMVLMFQKELADRICAQPGSKEYGIPSVFVNMYTECSRVLLVPATCFYPVPKVTSAVLRMVIRDSAKIDLKSHDFFVTLVKQAFSQRRKTLANNLKSFLKKGFSEQDLNSSLISCGIDGRRRAETLSVTEFGRLSNLLYKTEKS